VRPSDPHAQASIRPLSVRRHDGMTNHEWEAKVSKRVHHTAKILLAAFGEEKLQ